MLQLLFPLIRAIEPFLVPFCFVLAWGYAIALVWGLISMARDATTTAKRMHEVPCTTCRFFTDNYHLKCSVQPTIAETEEAIGCRDYSPQKYFFSIDR
ncbi:hypothetical protein IQ249_09375 [Lusitaniella coriacea LEGE 07157]|uniref:Uncharacterized protein n=1 Tax=Lusitaniella coriacea LEGE 07157 TaxID=945747 RepID=A0A8J7J228_9CYAN|nr:hypothetical protein [Lusitaniella coriacea]MBE9116104.1 hypothetical protein [Lusitaniella coriacea LEGE 07157]